MSRRLASARSNFAKEVARLHSSAKVLTDTGAPNAPSDRYQLYKEEDVAAKDEEEDAEGGHGGRGGRGGRGSRGHTYNGVDISDVFPTFSPDERNTLGVDGRNQIFLIQDSRRGTSNGGGRGDQRQAAAAQSDPRNDNGNGTDNRNGNSNENNGPPQETPSARGGHSEAGFGRGANGRR